MIPATNFLEGRGFAIEHIAPVLPVPQRSKSAHDWHLLQRPIPTEQADIWAVTFRCAHCGLEKLVLCSAAETLSRQYRQPGWCNWASLSYLTLSCPPSAQELLTLQRIGGHV